MGLIWRDGESPTLADVSLVMLGAVQSDSQIDVMAQTLVGQGANVLDVADLIARVGSVCAGAIIVPVKTWRGDPVIGETDQLIWTRNPNSGMYVEIKPEYLARRSGEKPA